MGKEKTGTLLETDSISPPPKILVLGVGNLLLSDEGVGVHIAQKLLTMDLPTEVEVIEGGTDGFGLINIISEADHVVVVDAVRGGGSPGSIYRFGIQDIRDSSHFFKTSFHQVGILEIVSLSGLLGRVPETTVIGIEPKSVTVGMDLSPEIQGRVSRIIELICTEIDWIRNGQKKAKSANPI
ncbi:MAG: hydrogenase maturation protease [Thermodesulfobacteriota bacterium]|nr:hydrogenase maturation protease [Thermodesulfobacteriota bacterium]